MPYELADLVNFFVGLALMALVIGTVKFICDLTRTLWRAFHIMRLGQEEYERRSYEWYVKHTPWLQALEAPSSLNFKSASAPEPTGHFKARNDAQARG